MEHLDRLRCLQFNFTSLGYIGNKIRHYKIEDRGNLRNIHSSEWPKQYEKYLKDVSCPFKLQERQEAIDWLLGLAVRLEYGDNAAKYQVAKPLNTEATKSVEPLINLDAMYSDNDCRIPII
ncbi:TPA: hypothetical protein GDO54_018664 [Pyxicephalus adspersus]|uniref:RNA transcription, translation and transport factor protein n=1 Tax=Pyxicephalus adspersus TaxID=30357 RepID=A0AAV2ZNT5_PYXAD|nr:TPA: hypothetical protein GDO54_018664 [Pyxicephalus adspersus]